jgi:UDP-N-acetylmuramate dehydrogenase
MALSSAVANAQHFFREKQATFEGQILFDEPLSKHTYYRIGGPAAILAFPKSIGDLQILAQGIAETGIPFFILGMGSNLLVADAGIPGLVIRATKLNLEMKLDPTQNAGRQVLRTGGSVAISSLLRRASQEGWGGLEFLTGIPGSIGGAVRMNAGTHLGETKDRLIAVEAYSFEQLANTGNSGPESCRPELFKDEALRFEYRKNLFLPKNTLVYAAEWAITKSDPAQVKATIDQTLSRRKATQPIDYPSCGSVFINPKFPGPKSAGLHSWQVIDQLGLRGHRIGNAQFSEKHCNFIVNLGGAKASDVKNLINLAKSQALSKLGITLEEEVIYFGFNLA